MRALLRRSVLLGLLAGLFVTAFASPALGAARWHRWHGAPSGIFRSAALSRGEWIYSNGLGQALGANADGKHRTEYFNRPGPLDPGFVQRDLYLARTYDFFGSHRSTHNGDYHVPQDSARFPSGTADLSELRLATDRRYLYVRFVWNAMPRRDAQIATLTFASAARPPVSRPWPRGARLSSPWSAALTTWGSGGALARTARRERRVSVRTGSHVTEARVPLRLLPRGPWTLSGGAGLDDPHARGHYWNVPAGDATADHPGSGGSTSPTNVWDLLFAPDRPWTFDERRQADDLARGSAASDTARVDPRALRGRRSARPPTVTGDFSRQFSSRLFEHDGIRVEGGAGGTPSPPSGSGSTEGFNQTWLYTGRRQYYGMHVPGRYPASHRSWPLIVYLHGFTGLPDEAFHNPVGLIRTADQKGYLVATPLGRGDYFYRGPGDLDVLEVIRDVQRHYHVDRSRIYLMGHSMGGYGTNNVAMRHPDLFAAVAPAQGTDSIDLHRNLRNLPWFEMSSEQDLDAHAANARKLYGNLSADGYDATLLVYATKIHEYSSIYDTLPRLFRFFGAHRRVRDPAQVTWTRPDASEDQPRVGDVYDGAYWVRGVRAAARGVPATVTLTSDAIGHRVADPERASRSDQMVDEGGPTGRTRGELTQTSPGYRGPARGGNVLHVDAAGAAALRADLRRARLRVTHRRALRVEVSTGHALRLGLSGIAGRRVTVRIDGRRARVLRLRRHGLVVGVPSGRHVLRIRAR